MREVVIIIVVLLIMDVHGAVPDCIRDPSVP